MYVKYKYVKNVKYVKCVVLVLLFVCAMIFVSKGDASAPSIAVRIAEHKDFFLIMRGFEDHRVYDVRGLVVPEGTLGLRDEYRRLIGLVLHDNIGFTRVVVFDRATSEVVARLGVWIESRDARQRRRDRSIRVEDARRIARAAYVRQSRGGEPLRVEDTDTERFGLQQAMYIWLGSRRGAHDRQRAEGNLRYTAGYAAAAGETLEATGKTADDWDSREVLERLRAHVKRSQAQGIYPICDTQTILERIRAAIYQ